MKKKQLLYKHSHWLLTIVFGVAVFLFWRFRYPYALTYQEQYQLFLFDGDYFRERMMEPGGLARYVAEFLVQFYNSVTLGALVIAVLFMLVQRLTWRVMDDPQASADVGRWYPLSFLPVTVLWYAMGDESVLLTYAVALIMAMAAIVGWRKLTSCHVALRWLLVVVLIPLLYWLIGPLVVLVAVCMIPVPMAIVAVVYTVAIVLASAWVLPYPLMRLVVGVGYYRFPEILPYALMLVPVLIAILYYGSRFLPVPKRWMLIAQALLFAVMILFPQEYGFEEKKYELIEYDYLVRTNQWNAIIAKAEKKAPNLPMSVSATNLALAKTNRLGDRLFDFYQHGSEGLLPKFERNFNTIPLTGEIYFHLGLVNTAQRFAFEGMEALPNYNKSARLVKRLAETNLINGQYEVARKYLKILEKTMFYRPWAQRTMALLNNEKAINGHPVYGVLRHYRLQDDFLFSEEEIDKIYGQLFMHNHQNTMAMQYLVAAPLLDGDADRFMAYVSYVQSEVSYNPRYVREAIAKIRRVPSTGSLMPNAN